MLEPPLPSTALSRDGEATLAAQLAARYAERIEQQLLAPGARLPSVRECARRHTVSPSTVVAAYDQLAAQGLVEARPQRGFFVRGPQAGRRAAARAQPAPSAPRIRPTDAATMIRGMFHGVGTPGPGMGTLPPDWLDLPLLNGAMRRATADDDSALRYGEPAGDLRFRTAFVQRLADVGIGATPAQLLTTMGATHALDIVCRTLTQPGDAVLVDEPGWPIEFARLARLGLRVLPVPRGAQGPDLEVLRTLAQAHRPRLYITVSVLHNPTGAMLSLAAAHQVLKLAESCDFTIVEDDTYAYLAPAHVPRLSALDNLQRSIYLTGFSKILTPNWRVGCIATTPAMADRLIDTKLLGMLSTPTAPERALAVTLEQGSLRRHAERVIVRLEAARHRTQQLAEEAGFRFAAPPQGLFGWVDAGVDTERLTEAMLDRGWLLAPGTLFHATPRPTSLMRVNFATAQNATLWDTLRQVRSEL
ncbi:PLP-dependent aminotransferase family protein [Aquincola tertiaricarbonis]|uniref:PLP-dependent aminotransferase family protein n=2 Tax=Aquincola tertiaricarbonis TaxID=391953 RepID=A0ABY4SJ37_AQUTE|nr:PLP-dependent aminotransferase family protein [Aquincola tertiaricarbonis]URI11952.1 PLP-dependent aminotransferase family protein [Aquincola tertiaricarbonis]